MEPELNTKEVAIASVLCAALLAWMHYPVWSWFLGVAALCVVCDLILIMVRR